MRLQILLLCLISAINTFIHYGLISPLNRAKMFFLHEFFRFVIMFGVCHYFCSKASGLLKNKRKIIKYLNIWGVTSVILIICMGLQTIMKIDLGMINFGALCTTLEFESYRYYTIVTCVFFSVSFFQIKNSILEEPRETAMDQKIFEKQMQIMKKLKCVIIIFSGVSLFLIISD